MSVAALDGSLNSVPTPKANRPVTPARKANENDLVFFIKPLRIIVGGRGFEPPTPSVSRKCSTTELTARAVLDFLLATHRSGKIN